MIGVESRIGNVSGSVPDRAMLLSIKAAAEQLGISRSVLYELIRSGEVENLRIGRRILISREALQRFIDTNSRSGYNP